MEVKARDQRDLMVNACSKLLTVDSMANEAILLTKVVVGGRRTVAK